MIKPTLLIMAAGMGSRFGGNKQITPIDAEGNLIIDYSIFDALRAGFEDIVIIIKHSFENEFKKAIGDRIAKKANVRYAYQEIDMLPAGFSVPENRVKPWGTGHAVLCAKDMIDSPFCAINADDFYGADSFEKAYSFLTDAGRPENEHAMIAYHIENTLTDNGSVSRGVCDVDANGCLLGIVERTKIFPAEGGAKYLSDDGATYTFIPSGTSVSMNMWCFGKVMMDRFEKYFTPFLKENLAINPLKCEYYLPSVPNLCLKDGTDSVKVIDTSAKWYGMTYREDVDGVVSAVAQMKADGKYPRELWG